jgi:hypothetical protein
MQRESSNFNNFDEFILEGDLNALVEHFESVGLPKLAAKLRAIIESTTTIDLAQSVTIEAAARMLKLRSPSFLRTVARGGSLDGAEVGERFYVTRASVARFMESPELATQRRMEKELWSVLGSG